MSETRTIINGVDVDGLTETMEIISEKPGLGKFQFRAKSKWIDGGHYRSQIQDFYGAGQEDASRDKPFVLEGDEPPVLLGENRGPNPVEFILHALVGCVGTTFIYYAAAQGVKIDGVEYTLEGDLDVRGLLGLAKDVRPGYQDIRLTMNVRSDAPRAKLDELCQLAQMRSPVFNTISQPVPISVALEKVETGAQAKAA